MDRREFLETLAVVPATIPLVAHSTPAEPAGIKPQRSSSEAALPGASPRIRENFNRSWRFARQSHGTGALGSFDRQNEVAAQVEPRFRQAHHPEYDDAGWDAINLPHTWNAYDTMDEEPGYWRGIGWYRKHFKLASIQARPFFLNSKVPAASRSSGSMANASANTKVVTPALKWT